MTNQKTAPSPADYPEFTSYLAAALGTRNWVVAERLTKGLQARGYELAVRSSAYRAFSAAWEKAHGWVNGTPPELLPDWVNAAIAAYRPALDASIDVPTRAIRAADKPDPRRRGVAAFRAAQAVAAGWPA